MNITLQQLEYIVAVDTYRHYVTAAEKSFVTQPTLSMQVKKLEEQLGVVLFDRSKQPIVPTEVGAQIITQARETLNQGKKIYEIVKNYQGKVRGELTIGIIPTLAPYLVPLFVGTFLKKYPEVDLTIKECLTTDLLKELVVERLDAGIIVTPLQEKGIIEKKLFYEEIALYSQKGVERSEISVEELDEEQIWLLAKGHCFRSQMVNLCSNVTKQETPNFNYESGSLESLKNLVQREGGSTLLPELAFTNLSSDQKGGLRHIGKVRPYREISLVYSRAQAKISALNALEGEIKASVPEHMIQKKENIVEWK